MNLDNTKVYTTDPEVIRKYAELCGKEIEQPNGKFKGYYSPASHGKVCYFIYHSCVDSDDEFKTITTDQINALYDERFVKVETPEEAEAFDSIKPLDGSYPGVNSDPAVSYHDDTPVVYPLHGSDIVEWDGEGLPPVGVECQYSDGVKWHNVKIKYSSDWVVVIECLDEGTLSSLSTIGVEISMPWNKATELQFRKPETPQQREERERNEWAQNVICEMMDATGLDFTQDGDVQVVKAMYDLGYRKQKDGD